MKIAFSLRFQIWNLMVSLELELALLLLFIFFIFSMQRLTEPEDI